MKKYLVIKIISAPILFLIVLSVTFTIIHLAPGDPTAIFFSDATAPPGAREALKKSFGLDKPIYEQYFIYLYNMFTGNWGFSYVNHQPVFELIADRLSATLELVFISFILSVFLGVYIGMVAATRPYSKTDNLLSTLSLVIYSTPQFWIGLIALIIFGVYFRWFPIGGTMTAGLTGLAAFFDQLRHLVLPTAVLALGNAALWFRLTRASMLEQIRSDYVLTAWSKGCSRRRVYYYHAFRNALLPIVSMLIMYLPWVFAGTVVIETVFSWPGIGRLLFDAINARDYNVVMAVYAMTSAIVIIFSIIGDILYAFVDPRIKLK